MSNYTPILGDIYTRKNGKKYEVREHDGEQEDVCCDTLGKQCAFYKKDCSDRRCPFIVYIRRKDLEQ